MAGTPPRGRMKSAIICGSPADADFACWLQARNLCRNHITNACEAPGPPVARHPSAPAEEVLRQADDRRLAGHLAERARNGGRKLVLELVPISAHLTALRRTEAGPKPRFSPQMDLS